MLTHHRFKTLLLLLTSLALFQGSCAQGPYQAYVPVGGGRDEETKEQKVLIDHGGLVSALSAADATTTPASLSFLVEGEVFVCDLRPSALMAPGLQEKVSPAQGLHGKLFQRRVRDTGCQPGCTR